MIKFDNSSIILPYCQTTMIKFKLRYYEKDMTKIEKGFRQYSIL